jgi:hypothetical protein
LLQNRFNKVLQAEVNKYFRFLQSTLHEYHSGWLTDDYICDAKKRKIFKHESVHRIQKKSLPKYEIVMIVISSCYARVGWAFFFMANEDDVLDNANQDNGGSTLDKEKGGNNIRANEFHDDQSAVVDSSLVTPRPSIGKKKAKVMDFAERRLATTSSACNIATSTTDTAMKKVEFCNTAKTSCNNSLIRLAAAAEAKNLLLQEQQMFQLSMQNPDSVQLKAFFVTMSQRYTLQMQQFTMNDGSTVLTHPAGGDLPVVVLLEDKGVVQLSPLEEELPKSFETILQVLDLMNKHFSSKFQVPSPGALVGEQGT